MITRRRKNLTVACSILFLGLMWSGSTLSNIKTVAPSKNEHQTPEAMASFFSGIGEAVPFNTAAHQPLEHSRPDTANKPDEKDIELKPDGDVPKALRNILENYFEETDIVHQERAFKRVISWKADLENIAAKYHNVNWKMLSAIIKAETQGKTGRQESRAKAVGISQIKYQGAWAFIWDALFRQEIKSGSGYVKDYYNAQLRARYHDQLQHICQYLEKNKILVKPAGRSEKLYRKARSVSWTNLKAHLEKKYKPGEYQIAVDIAAIYIDHLITTFQSVKHQVAKIKECVGDNQFDDFSKISLSGTTETRWNSIKSKLSSHKDEHNFRKITLDRLDHILSRLEDPNIYSAAYNLGISKCLQYMESGMKFPEGISRYVRKVSSYHAIFSEIDLYRLYT